MPGSYFTKNKSKLQGNNLAFSLFVDKFHELKTIPAFLTKTGVALDEAQY